MAKNKDNKTDSLDLSSINIPTKTKKNKTISVRRLFKKQSGPNRDEEGKFAAKSIMGTGGLDSLKKLNLQRIVPVVVLVAVIGGALVFSSFAAGSKAVVRGWYKSCLGKSADKGGLDYWSGRLDKGESQSSVLAAFKAAANVTVCDKNKSSTSTTQTNTTQSNSSSTQTNSTQTSQSVELKSAQAWVELGKAHLINAKKENDHTYGISLQTSVTRENLQDIANREAEVRGKLSQMQGGKTEVQSLYNKAISKSESRVDGPAILDIVNVIQDQIESLDAYVINISYDYKRAEKVYEDGLNAQAAQNQQNSSSSIGTSDSTGCGGCQTPTSSPGDSLEKIKADWKKWCEAAPNYLKTVDITGGTRTDVRDVYYDGSGKKRCNNRFLSVKSIKCNVGYSASTNMMSCNKKSSQSNNNTVTFAKMPGPLCYKLSNTNLKSQWCTDLNAMKAIKESDNPDISYYSKYRRCLKQFGTLRSCKWITENVYYQW
ncbi:hypothetical protein KDA08_03405 [Candidatus Saccharibacteria bacterium]|nr:hypothetical protein [Candidatus Saccharibacteria bacterium]